MCYVKYGRAVYTVGYTFKKDITEEYLVAWKMFIL